MAATVGTPTTSGSNTFSHEVVSGETFLVVGITDRNSRTTSSVTYDGVSMTKADERNQGSGVVASIWYLAEPNVGTADVVQTLSGSNINHHAYAVSMSADGTLSAGDASNNGATSSSQRTVTVQVEGDEGLVFDSVSQNGSGCSFTNVSPTTTLMSGTDSGSFAGGYRTHTGSNITMQWNKAGSCGTPTFSMIGFEVVESSGGGSGTGFLGFMN